MLTHDPFEIRFGRSSTDHATETARVSEHLGGNSDGRFLFFLRALLPISVISVLPGVPLPSRAF